MILLIVVSDGMAEKLANRDGGEIELFSTPNKEAETSFVVALYEMLMTLPAATSGGLLLA